MTIDYRLQIVDYNYKRRERERGKQRESERERHIVEMHTYLQM